MDLTPRTLAATLAGLAAATALAVGLQAHEGVVAGKNLYRYTVAQSGASSDCGYDWIELGASGRTLAMTARPGADPDDGAAVVELREPFELYQDPQDALVVSANGYIAAAASLAEEDGSDFGNDCPLPRVADNPAASEERVHVYHDDLRPRREGGQVRHAWFADCPRRGAARSGAPSCTVVEWNGFERSGPLRSTQPLRAQAVLYHGTGEVALQYASVDDSQGGSATVGLQGFGGRAATQAGCNSRDTVRPQRTVCFYDPRHPPRPAAPR